MNHFSSLLKKSLKENAIVLDESAQQKLVHYLELFTTWNRTFNLTSITTPRDMVYLHIIDSLAISPFLHGTKILDVGSGAGLPGIPLAILHPEKQWTLVDKTRKKTQFLTQVIAELHLPNVQIIHSRAEDFHPTTCFDSILSRAYGTLGLFLTQTEHLLCPDGLFLAMKGKYPEAELQEIPNRFAISFAKRVEWLGIKVERHVVGIYKTS